jgi:hypothetical protein
MLRRQGYLARIRMYPELSKAWLENGRRKQRRLPPLPLPDVGAIKRRRVESKTSVTVVKGRSSQEGAPSAER